MATYGDYYHDKGEEKAQAFLDGYCFALGIDNREVDHIEEIKVMQ